MKKLGLVIVLLCLSMAVSAGGFMFKHLEVKDGLSSNRVNDIFKDSEGFMWFATASGLNRYDGCQMKVYRSHNLDLGPLPDNCVQKVQIRRQLREWVDARKMERKDCGYVSLPVIRFMILKQKVLIVMCMLCCGKPVLTESLL